MSQKHKITVFSTTHCPSCQTLKSWLKSQDLVFEAVNIDQDLKRQEEMVAKSGSFLVPVTLIEIDGREEVVSGLQYAQIKKILGI